LGQGRNNVARFLKDNPELTTVLEGQVREKLGLAGSPAEPQEQPQPSV
ncbi:MAG: DNA recombination/repair protein RecA, partial [Deltaproteobacteria bacterium]|nr:DNA recombination/repair protein RecA [Deltaproteobacteria bacterium]